MFPGTTVHAPESFASEANTIMKPIAYKFPAEACMSPGGPEKPAEASERSQGSTTHSATSTVEMDEEQVITPDAMDIRRLMRQKAEQEQKLQMLRARVDRLTAQERRVWKDVAWTQQMSLQAQENQWRRQTQQAERLRTERELLAREQALRERTREMRQRATEAKAMPRTTKFEENKVMAQRARQDSRRLKAALQEVRDETLQRKQLQVEYQRQQRRQQKLRRELEQTRREQARQDLHALKYAELQEELQSVEAAIAAAECEELTAVSRLQNSQSVRAEAISQLQASRANAGACEEAAVPDDTCEACAAPAEGSGGGRSLAASARGSRSSPRLLGGSPPRSPQQLSPGSPLPGSPPPACASRQQQQEQQQQQQHRLAGSRSSGVLATWSPRSTSLGQITEEEEGSSVECERSPVELVVEEFRQQVASFQAQSQHFQVTAQAVTAQAATQRRHPVCPSADGMRRCLPHSPTGSPGGSPCRGSGGPCPGA